MPRVPRRIATLAASAALVVLASAPASLPGSHQAHAADRGLVVIVQTTYEALPEDRRVHVTMIAVATSYTPNPPDGGLAYYPATEFAAQAGATNFTASSGADALDVDVDPSDPDFYAVTVNFADFVYYQESYPFRVEFDLPDPGGAPDRDLRISPSIVAFPIWAFGTSEEPGSSVTVVLPVGFRPEVQGAALSSSSGAQGEVVLSTGTLSDPYAFFAYLLADRPGAFSDTLLEVPLGDESAAVRVRAWQDDPEWGMAMVSLLTDGLPALVDLIGLPYDAPGTLVVEEAATSRLGEYAGIYNRLTGIIRVRYDADGFVGLHEAAHIWFNGDFLRGRWIGEAWAEFYGVMAAQSIGETGTVFDLSDELLEFKIALNDWGGIGQVALGVEEYAYAASYNLALLIFERTDVAGLQSVWHAIDDAEMAYQPANGAAAPETGVDFDLDGWQQLLDLLEERTGNTYDDLWIEWVVSTDQEEAMADRAAARDHYADVVTEADDWNLPTDLRYAMGSWEFEAAETDLDLADDVLAARDEIEASAGELGLTPPAALQDAFEGDDGLAAAKAEATQELDVLAGIAAAGDRLDDEKSPLEVLGLLGSDPDAALDAARDAFEADDLDTADDAAAQALATREGAESAGQLRAAIGGGGLLVLVGGPLLAVRIRRRRDRSLVAHAMPAPAAPDAPSPTDDPSDDPR